MKAFAAFFAKESCLHVFKTFKKWGLLLKENIYFQEGYYSWLLLSRPRLSRITAYLEVKIWSLLKSNNR